MMKQWQVEFIFFKHPNLATNCGKEILGRVFGEIDWKSSEVRIWKHGWDCAVTCIDNALHDTIQEFHKGCQE